MREAVGFILVREGSFLAERRGAAKTLDPGALAIPGGHVEEGEDRMETLSREMREELGVTPRDATWVSTQVHQALYPIKIHFYHVRSWEGEIEAREADELLWVRLSDWREMDLEADRAALRDLLVTLG